ncbi:diguanylate cyclase, partial [Deinococcus sp.]|uniref:GGDEF domain-containing response regulator n=1 Tax=Deinococcus sp. TaxID=47478 RepID=UPI002869B436
PPLLAVPPGPGLNVLIIDDSPVVRLMLTRALEPLGAHVNCPASLAVAREHLGMAGGGLTGRGTSDIDVVLLDQVMPEMDGVSFLREMRGYAHLQELSVIMVTGVQDEAQLEVAFDSGAMDYVTKPCPPATLRARTFSGARLTRALRASRERALELLLVNAQLADLNGQLQSLSMTDALTGLANRRAFDLAFDHALGHHDRSGLGVALLMIDIDHFKRYNDALGHPAGDMCLQQVAAVLSGCVRRSTDLVARYGGEEFAALLSDTDVIGAEVVARRILERLTRERLTHPDHPLGIVTVSMGLAALPHAVDHGLKDAADHALYRAKAGGRNRAELWTPPVGDRA